MSSDDPRPDAPASVLPGRDWNSGDAGVVLGVALLIFGGLLLAYQQFLLPGLQSHDSDLGRWLLGHPVLTDADKDMVGRIVSMWAAVGSQLLWVAVLLGIVGPMVLKRGIVDFGMQWGDVGRSLRWFVGVALIYGICTFAGWGICYVATKDDLFRDYIANSGLTDGPSVLLWTWVVAALIVAPIAEEVVFRGGFFRGIRDQWGFWAGMLLSAGVFGLLHWAGGQLPFIPLLGGIGFAYLYEKTGSLLAPALLHFTGNAFVLGVSLYYSA